MNFSELVKSRYSVRSFKDEQVSKADLDAILETVKYAPTACNLQPQKVYVIQSPEALAKLETLTKCRYGAPTVLLVCYDESVAWHNKRMPGYQSGETDAAIVTTQMMLKAWEIGVGSCWVGMFSSEEVVKAYGLPENTVVEALLPIGYPAEDSKPIQMHFDTKADEDIIKYL